MDLDDLPDVALRACRPRWCWGSGSSRRRSSRAQGVGGQALVVLLLWLPLGLPTVLAVVGGLGAMGWLAP